jgi:hypothetical protein
MNTADGPPTNESPVEDISPQVVSEQTPPPASHDPSPDSLVPEPAPAPPPASNAPNEYIEVTGATGPNKEKINGVYKKSENKFINNKNRYDKYDLSTKLMSNIYIIFIVPPPPAATGAKNNNNKWYFTYIDSVFEPENKNNNYFAVGDCQDDELIGCSNWQELIPDTSDTSDTSKYTLETSSIQIAKKTIVEELPKEKMVKLVSEIDERRKDVTAKYQQLNAGSSDDEWKDFEKILEDAIDKLNHAEYTLETYKESLPPPSYSDAQSMQVLPSQSVHQYHRQGGSTTSKKNKKSHRSYHPKIGKTRKRHNTHNKPKRVSFVHQA